MLIFHHSKNAQIDNSKCFVSFVFSGNNSAELALIPKHKQILAKDLPHKHQRSNSKPSAQREWGHDLWKKTLSRFKAKLQSYKPATTGMQIVIFEIIVINFQPLLKINLRRRLR
jgi:hypothetical protein